MVRQDLPNLTGGAVGAVIFDLDGIITDTASVHTTAWKSLFDGYLRDRARRDGSPFSPFTENDYLTYVDGKPRYDGVKSFLESRDIELDWGTPSDSPETETICGLGNRKNGYFLEALSVNGAQVFPTTVELLKRLRRAEVAIGCVSSSNNCRFVLRSVDLLDEFDAIIDGTDAAARHLPGKPAPDTYLECARLLDVDPAQAAMVEDAISGVTSGAAGGFRHVIGVDRGAGREELLAAGATVVVSDLGEFLRSG